MEDNRPPLKLVEEDERPPLTLVDDEKKNGISEPTNTSVGNSPKISASAYQPESVESQLPSEATISGSTPSTSDLLKSQVKQKSNQIIQERTAEQFANNPLFQESNPNFEKNRQVFLEHTKQTLPKSQLEDQWGALQPIADLANKLGENAVEGTKEGVKKAIVGQAMVASAKDFKTAAQGELKKAIGAGEAGFSAMGAISPHLAAFNTGIELLNKMPESAKAKAIDAIDAFIVPLHETSEKGPTEKEKAEKFDNLVSLPFTLASTTAKALGYEPKPESWQADVLEATDLIIPIIAGKVAAEKTIKSINDVQDISKKVAEGTATPEEAKDLNNVSNEFEKLTVEDIKEEAQKRKDQIENQPIEHSLHPESETVINEQSKAHDDLINSKAETPEQESVKQDLISKSEENLAKQSDIHATVDAEQRFNAGLKASELTHIDSEISPIDEYIKANADNPAVVEKAQEKLKPLQERKAELEPQETNVKNQQEILSQDEKDELHLLEFKQENRKATKKDIARLNELRNKEVLNETNKTTGSADKSENLNLPEKPKVKRVRVGTPKSRRKISEKANEALRVSDKNPSIRDRVLQYFIKRGQLKGAAIDELYGDGGNKSTYGEKKARLDYLNNKDGLSINEIADKLAEQDYGKPEGFSSKDYKSVVEQVINDHVHRDSMENELLDKYDTKHEVDAEQEMSEGDKAHYDELDRLQEEEAKQFVGETNDYWDELTDAEKEALYNDFEGNIEKIINEKTAGESKAEKEYEAELTDIEDKLLAAKKAKQNKLDKLSGKAELFGEEKRSDQLFSTEQDLSQENIDAQLKPFNDKISNIEKEKQDFIDNKESYLNKYKGQTEISISEKATEIADKLRSGKLDGTMSAPPLLKQAWNTAIEIAAKAIEAGGDILQAIEDAVKSFKESEYYQKLSDKNKDLFESHLREELDGLKPKEESGLKNEDTAKQREKLGMDKYEGKGMTDEEAYAQAKRWIADGGDVQDIISKAKEDKFLSKTESAVLAEYDNSLQAKYETDPSPELLAEIKDLIELKERQGNLWSAAGQGRQLAVKMQDNLANFIINAEKAQGFELTAEQKTLETNTYKELKAKNKALEEALNAEKEQHAKDIAELGYNKAKAKANKLSKKSHTEYVSERASIVNGAKDALKKLRTQSNVATVPLLNEVKALAPFIKEVAKSYANEGVDKLDVVVNNIHAEFKDAVAGLRKKDIIDALAGVHDEVKETKPQKLNKVKLLEREAELLNQIANARKGIEKDAPIEKNKKTARIKELEDKLKEVKKANKTREFELDEAPIDKGLSPKKVKTAEELDAEKLKSVQAKINQLKTELKDRDFSIEEKPKAPFVPSRKVLDLKDQKIALEKTIAVRRYNAEQAKMKGSKLWNAIKQIGAVRRIVQTAVDWSIMGRQLAPITFNPKYSGVALKALKAQNSSTWSVAKFDRLMHDLHQDPLYHEKVADGIIFNDMNTGGIDHINEEFQKSFITEIPVLGDIIKGSNRAADAALNTARNELYNKKAKWMTKNGVFRETHPEEYKRMAQHVMNLTGRGKMLELLESRHGKEIMSQTFFGARLMASRFNLIKPSTYIDAKALNPFSDKKFKDYDEVKKSAISDIIGFTSGVAVAVLTAKAAGATVSMNPDDPDFLQVRFGKKVYDFTGGVAPYLRTSFRIMEAAGARAQAYAGTKTDKEASSAAKFAFSSVTRFGRNKLAPNLSYGTNALWGQNTIGEDFNPYDIIKVYPLYVDDFIEAMKEDGISSVATTLAPNLIGIGYGSYDSKSNLDMPKHVSHHHPRHER